MAKKDVGDCGERMVLWKRVSRFCGDVKRHAVRGWDRERCCGEKEEC